MFHLVAWLVLGATGPCTPPASRPPVVIKFKELVEKLRGWRGEVVVVDFWSDG